MKRMLSLVLCFLLVHTIMAADAWALAPASDKAPSHHAVQVAAAVARLGAGGDSVVALRLQNRTVLKGRISALARDFFVVTDTDSGADHRVPYAVVTRLEGANLASGERVHVGGGFKAAAARVALLVVPLHRVQKNSLTSGEKTLLIGVVVGVLLAIILAKVL